MPRFGFALCLALALACSAPGASLAQGDSLLSQRLSADRIGGVEPGTYTAADRIHFTLDSYGDKFLLRFDDSPEIYVLYEDHVSLGGRELKYDSGRPALLISSFGGMTLYTDDDPSGLPVVRDGDSDPPSLVQLSLPDMESAAQDESEHLAYADQISLNFTADWNALAGDANLRALGFDAMQNAARGLGRFAQSTQAHAALAGKITAVKIVPAGGKPTIAISGKTLVVTFNGTEGYAGRASSRAIARALGKLLSVPVSETEASE